MDRSLPLGFWNSQAAYVLNFHAAFFPPFLSYCASSYRLSSFNLASSIISVSQVPENVSPELPPNRI